VPDKSVIADGALREPPLGSAVMLKLTRAFWTRLPTASRTIAVMVDGLFVWLADLVVGWTVPGLAWGVTVLALVATKTTLRVAAGVPLGPDALMIAGPADADEIVTLATPGALPEAPVIAGLPEIVPRVAEKLTWPATGAPLLVQVADTGVLVFSGICTVVAGATAAGALNTRLALLMVSACVLLAPAPLAVMTSFPARVAVTVAVIWPELLVMPEAGLGTIVLPVCEVSVSATLGSGTPAESLTLKVSVVVAPNDSELLPLTVIAVPVTSTLLDPVIPSTLAVTVMVRLVLLAPRLSLAVTNPFASDTPAAPMLLMKAVGSDPVENVTVRAETACLLALSTTAVRSICVAPEEGICGLLTSNWTDAAVATGVVVVVPVVEAGLPPPQPTSTPSETLSNTNAENLEIFWLMKNEFRTEGLLCPVGSIPIMPPLQRFSNVRGDGSFHYL
jgi:hypothetical protein